MLHVRVPAAFADGVWDSPGSFECSLQGHLNGVLKGRLMAYYFCSKDTVGLWAHSLLENRVLASRLSLGFGVLVPSLSLYVFDGLWVRSISKIYDGP